MSDWVFTALWVAWALMFAAVEGVALMRKRSGDTLSEHVWLLLRLRGPAWFLGAGFLAWLVIHFLGFGVI